MKLLIDGQEVCEIESLQPIPEINAEVNTEQPARQPTFEFEATLTGNRIEDTWAEFISAWRAYEVRIRAEAKRAIEEYRRNKHNGNTTMERRSRETWGRQRNRSR